MLSGHDAKYRMYMHDTLLCVILHRQFIVHVHVHVCMCTRMCVCFLCLCVCFHVPVSFKIFLRYFISMKGNEHCCLLQIIT